jgi:hypothetical protein
LGNKLDQIFIDLYYKYCKDEGAIIIIFFLPLLNIPKEYIYIYIYNSLAGQMVDIEAIATHSTGSRGKGPRYLT